MLILFFRVEILKLADAVAIIRTHLFTACSPIWNDSTRPLQPLPNHGQIVYKNPPDLKTHSQSMTGFLVDQDLVYTCFIDFIFRFVLYRIFEKYIFLYSSSNTTIRMPFVSLFNSCKAKGSNKRTSVSWLFPFTSELLTINTQYLPVSMNQLHSIDMALLWQLTSWSV